jgi:N-methylhydantoinase A
VGQEFTLSVPASVEQLKAGDRKGVREGFDQLYEHRYAHHSPEEPVEIINVRVAALGKKPPINFPRLGPAGKAVPARERKVYFAQAGYVETPLYMREDLGAGATFSGPALVQEHGTTTVMYQGDVCTVAETGELIIKVRGE